jgi:hypothetical protein
MPWLARCWRSRDNVRSGTDGITTIEFDVVVKAALINVTGGLRTGQE